MAVALNWTSDMSKVTKDLDTAQRKIVDLENKLKGVTKESKNNQSAFTATFQNFGNQIKNAVAGYFTLSSAISLVNQGLAETKRLSDDTHRVQMSAADAQAEVVKNLGAVSTEQATRFLTEVEKIATASGAPSVAPVYQAAAGVLSGVAGDETLTKSILAESVPLFKNKMEDLPAFAGAVGDLATIAGATTREQVRSIVGMVLTTQSQARIVSLEAFKNAAPAIAAAATVDTGEGRIRAMREAGAMFAAIGGAIKDPEGALTKTATSEVATALSEMLPEKDIIDASGEVKRKGTGLKTLAERLKAVQASPELQRRFFETGEGMQAASFRGPITPVIRSLVTDQNSEVARRFQTAMGAIADDPRVVNQMLANLENATPQLMLSKFNKLSQSSVESFQLGSSGGLSSQTRKILESTLEQTRREPLGMGFLTDKAMLAAHKTAFDSPGGAIGMLRSREQELLKPGYLATSLGLDWVSTLLPPREENLPAERQEQLQLIRQQITLLEQLVEESKKTRMSNPGAGAVAAATLRGQSEGR